MQNDKNRHEVAWETHLLQEGYSREKYDLYVDYHMWPNGDVTRHVDVEHMMDHIMREWIQWYSNMGYPMSEYDTNLQWNTWCEKVGLKNTFHNISIQILTWCEKVNDPLP